MAEIFVDTVAWLALINTSDALHDAARQTLQQLRSQRAQLTTTEFILIEVADALCASNVRDRTVNFIDGLRRLPMLTVVAVSEELLGAGWNLYRQRSDKSWGLTDCISFVVMHERQLTQAFTSDQHFAQAGFVKLLHHE